MTKSFSMAGWRVAFMVGNPEVVAALAKLKSYLDYGTFQPIQIAATVTLNEAADYPAEVHAIYQTRRDALCDGLNRIGWEIEPPMGTMFAWAPIPEPYSEMGSVEFASFLVSEAEVALSPGVGFGPGGEGHVRFALIENEQRIGQAVRNLRRALTEARLSRRRVAQARPSGGRRRCRRAERHDGVGDLVGVAAAARARRRRSRLVATPRMAWASSSGSRSRDRDPRRWPPSRGAWRRATATSLALAHRGGEARPRCAANWNRRRRSRCVRRPHAATARMPSSMRRPDRRLAVDGLAAGVGAGPAGPRAGSR